MELNRILRPGGFFVWSATPVYRKDIIHRNKWEGSLSKPITYWLKQLIPLKIVYVKLKYVGYALVFLAAMVNLTESMCWKAVARSANPSSIGLVIYQKPDSYACYEKRKQNDPPICDDKSRKNDSW